MIFVDPDKLEIVVTDDKKLVIPLETFVKAIIKKEDVTMNFESISDLITTMVLQGASHEEITRIVAYSQKAIDAHKAYRDNNIAELERKYGGYISEERKEE